MVVQIRAYEKNKIKRKLSKTLKRKMEEKEKREKRNVKQGRHT